MNFRIVIDVRDVSEGDATDVAQRIWEAHAEDLDAARGDFAISVLRAERGSLFDTDWVPA